MERTVYVLTIFAKRGLYWVGIPPLLSQKIIPFE